MTAKGTHPPMSIWSIVAIVCLVVLFVSSGLALYYGVAAPNPTGTYASYVAYAMILLLTIFAIFGKQLDRHIVFGPKKMAPVTRKSVTTSAGSIQMVSN